MMRGGFCTGITVEELNHVKQWNLEGASESYWDEYLEYVGSDLYGSEFLRKQAIEAGYKILEIYPIYHQGWEMDAWGAIGQKDGKKWVLETNHDSLVIPTEPIAESLLKRAVLGVIEFMKRRE